MSIFKNPYLLILLVSFLGVNLSMANDELQVEIAATAELDKKQIKTVLKAVKSASNSWMQAFNDGDAKKAASLYAADAVMVAKPFGVFEGRKAIEAFWTQLISTGHDNVEYILPQVEVVDESTVIIKSGWRMNKAMGVITKELWRVSENGQALLVQDDFEVLISR